MEDERVDPAVARDPVEFVAALRALKERSGLTLRQLADQATARGDVLARSTVADLLRRRTLPRPELVVAFVRACGEQDRLADWMRAYERLVREATATTDAPVPENGHAVPPPSGRPHRARTRALPFLALVAVFGIAAVLVISQPDRPPAPDETSAGTTSTTFPDVLPISSAGEWARIRPARTPELCVTEGFERSRRYEYEVAVLRPCAEPGGPRTFLEPVGDDLTQIKWEHPETKAMGCLTIRAEGPGRDLLEPRDACRSDDDAQLFRIERFDDGDSDGYRLRRAHTDRCVGIRQDDLAEGAEAVQQPCGDGAGQRFLVDLNGPG